jgi:hypothetical protein
VADKYQYRFESKEVCTCDACDAIAPVKWFDSSHSDREDKGGWFCELCANTPSSNAYLFRFHEGSRADMQTICFCANKILDAVTGRKP